MTKIQNFAISIEFFKINVITTVFFTVNSLGSAFQNNGSAIKSLIVDLLVTFSTRPMKSTQRIALKNARQILWHAPMTFVFPFLNFVTGTSTVRTMNFFAKISRLARA